MEQIEQNVLKYVAQIHPSPLDERSLNIIKYLTKYALNHKLEELSIRRCANYLKISTSSIMRLANKIGVSGFNALKDYVANIIISLGFSNITAINTAKDNHLPLEPCLVFDHFDALNDRLKLANYLATQTLKINKNTILHLMKNLKSNPKVLVHGTGISGLVANYLISKLNKVGINACMFDLLSCHEAEINRLKDQNILILISKSGETDSVIKKVKLSEPFALDIYSITSNQANSLSKAAPHNINVMFNKTNEIDMNQRLLNYDSIIFLLIDSIIQLYLSLK
ncbi:transcriptional regulator [Gammaproteobacteria bacterium]|nr:transcriptional regulator [Gammaproteobacteria bacterium]